MSEEEIIYTNKEVSLLLIDTEAAKKQVNQIKERSALINLSHMLRLVKTRFQTLSEGYLITLTNKMSCPLNEHHDMIINMLFKEDIYKLPLHINDPIVGYIANFRLKIGK